MTALWMSISDAAVRLRKTPHQVLEMAVSGEIHSRVNSGSREVCAGAVAALVEQQRKPGLAAHGGDDQTAGQPIPRDPANPAEARMTPVDDDEYRKEQGT